MAGSNHAIFANETSNIFPIANSKLGGQLLTEYNLRSRESVATDPNIDFFAGQSFAHSTEDFALMKSSSGTSSLLQVAPGRAVVNGHYFECIDYSTLALSELSELGNGKYGIGLRAFYSTNSNILGALTPEDQNSNFVQGIQLVIVPFDDFKAPGDSDGQGGYVSEGDVTVHLKLGYLNKISSNSYEVTSYKVEKLQYIDPSRIKSSSSEEGGSSSDPSSVTGQAYYAYQGNIKDWHDIRRNLGVWKSAVELSPNNTLTELPEARFIENEDTAKLVVPIEPLHDESGRDAIYYKPAILPIPRADYEKGTAGVVSSVYTNKIKAISDKLNSLYTGLGLDAGKFMGYLDTLVDRVEEDPNTVPPREGLPHPPSAVPGSWAVVRSDQTVADTADAQYPSTLYIMTYGKVSSLYSPFVKLTSKPADWDTNYNKLYVIKDNNVVLNTDSDWNRVTQSSNVYYKRTYLDDEGNSLLTGRCLYIYHTTEQPKRDRLVPSAINALSYNGKPIDPEVEDVPQTSVSPTDPELDYSCDYFIWRTDPSNDGNSVDTIYRVKTTSTNAAYPTDANGNISTPLILTGQIALAQEDIVGGFYDVSDEATDQGYVHLDTDGRLRLIDYDLLRSGVLAYQLGEDYETPAGVTLEELQNYLDNYVNDRVAFPNANQRMNKTNHPEVIDITINLPGSILEGESESLYIRNIDSRFGSSINLHFTGEANTSITVFIDNCQKVRISDIISVNSPKIVLTNSCLYYDANIIDSLQYDTDYRPEGNTLWYQKYESTDPDLEVEYLTVKDVSGVINSDRITSASVSVENEDDAHFNIALSSLTFDNTLKIVGAGLAIQSGSTFYGEISQLHVGEFMLPSSGDLQYPSSKLRSGIKFTTDFLSLGNTITQNDSEAILVKNNITLETLGESTINVPGIGEQETNISGMYVWNIESKIIPLQIDSSDIQTILENLQSVFGIESWTPVDGRVTNLNE